jgi:hypothetical protein
MHAVIYVRHSHTHCVLMLITSNLSAVTGRKQCSGGSGRFRGDTVISVSHFEQHNSQQAHIDSYNTAAAYCLQCFHTATTAALCRRAKGCDKLQ